MGQVDGDADVPVGRPYLPAWGEVDAV
jgi:hypothetical protein